MMFKQWRAQRLIMKKASLAARQNAIYRTFKGIEDVPRSYIDEQINLLQKITLIEFKIEMLKDVK